MGNPRIVYTPRGEASTLTVDLGSLYGARGLQLFAGQVQTDAEISVSAGGESQAVFHGVRFEYQLRLQGISRTGNPQLWFNLFGLVAHLATRGQFAFQMDSAKTASTLLNGAVTKGDTNITVDSTTGMSAGDELFVEDANDPTKVDLWSVDTVGGGTSLTLDYGSAFSFADNSVVRHAEYFPLCVPWGRDPVRFLEREAGQGAYLWDLDLSFRTIRG